MGKRWYPKPYGLGTDLVGWWGEVSIKWNMGSNGDAPAAAQKLCTFIMYSTDVEVASRRFLLGEQSQIAVIWEQEAAANSFCI